MKSILLGLSLILVGSEVFAFAAYSARLTCVTARARLEVPFTNSQSDGFGFDEGGKIVINNVEMTASVISQNNQGKLGTGPSLFTVKSYTSKHKLGVIIRTKVDGIRKTVSVVSQGDDVGIEIFNANGVSTGTEKAVCFSDSI